jgi:hypothetical protein
MHLSYCLTNEDTSQDTKWTKIQQRCLISERAGHCSNVSTPRAERDQKQSRRLKEVQLQNNKKQQKERESEEKGKRKSTEVEGGKGEGEREKMVVEDKENGAGGGENLGRRREKESGARKTVEREGRSEGEGVLKSRRSLNFPRSDVRLVKSPTVKITRLLSSLSRKRQGGFDKPMPPPTSKNKETIPQTKASKSSSRRPLVVQQTAADVTNQNQAIEEGVMTSPIKGKSRTTTEMFEDGMQEDDDAGLGQEVGGDSSVAMESCSSVLSPSTPPCAGTSEGLMSGGTSSGVSSPAPGPALRRSPRLKKRLSDAKKGSTSHQDSGSDAKKKRKSDGDKKKEKSLKAVSHHFHTQNCTFLMHNSRGIILQISKYFMHQYCFVLLM